VSSTEPPLAAADVATRAASADGRPVAADDLETLVGPLLSLLTRVARHGGDGLGVPLREQLLALVRHPTAPHELRLVAGGMAAELPHRLHT
jgi:hypothetical protein